MKGCFFFAWIAFIITSVIAWLHHVIYCLQHIQTAYEWAILLAGVILPPVGILHGYGLWFGWFAQ